jgi:Ser/Thr protein kinase RdoA (MazF antagonist)
MTLSVVATGEASVTTLSASLAAALRERYGWTRLDVMRRLTGGYANEISLADADGELVVVRVVRPPIDPAGLEWEHELLGLLAAKSSIVIAPLRALDQGTFFMHRGNAVVVMPFVDARPAEPWFDRAAAAKALGTLHHAAAQIEIGTRPGGVQLADLRAAMDSGRYFAKIGPTARPWPAELATRRAELDDAREWALRTVETLACEDLTTAPIHGDIFRGNVLVREHAVMAFVDWEEANVDWAASDLANAMWEFCKYGDHVLDRVAAREFVRVYREAGGTVPADEDQTLIPLVRVRRVLELLRAPYDTLVDWNYQLCNLEAFQSLG